MIPKFNHCEACGMPMMTPKDHGAEDEKNTWCKHCCDNQGNHKSYEKILESMINFMLSYQGEQMSGIKFKSKEEAKNEAIKYLSNMPAWKNKN